MCITVQQLSYMHLNKEILFENVTISLKEGEKAALIGNNGSGKSTLLKLIGGQLPAMGTIHCSTKPYYIPQHFGQFDEWTVARALQTDLKLGALHAILNGETTPENFEILDDDWNLEEKIKAALSEWNLSHISLSQKLKELSGGEKTMLFLAGITVYNPKIVLLDEPTNHLDAQNREKLYRLIGSFPGTLLIVSHDRTLLNALSTIYELNKQGITVYGGNYEFYKARMEEMNSALYARLEEKEKELRVARKMAKEAVERKQKREAHDKKNSSKKGISRMAVNTLKDKAEKSTSKLKDVHSDKLDSITESLREIQNAIPDKQLMKVNFNPSSLHCGKILVTAHGINIRYSTAPLWKHGLNFQIKSGERIEIKGGNGAGKSSLLKLITQKIKPSEGILTLSDFKYVYLDQEYSIIENHLTVFEQISQFNRLLQDHEVKAILNRFLFIHGTWDKLCGNLSGGEKMKLAFCCLMVQANTPDLFILDEPTNNIDLRNIDILTEVIKNYRGTVLVVSHDRHFIEQININRSIGLSQF